MWHAALPTPVQIRHEPARQRLTLLLPASLAGQAVAGQVHFFRPSNQKLDFTVPLRLAADLQQSINTSKMPLGFWRVQLAFTAGGRAYFIEQDLLLK